MQLSLDFGGEKLNDSWPHGRRDFDIWGEWRRNVGEEMIRGVGECKSNFSSSPFQSSIKNSDTGDQMIKKPLQQPPYPLPSFSP
jgi:hypothetical protein